MKKKAAFFLVALMLCTLAACGSSGDDTSDTAADTQPESTTTENEPAPEAESVQEETPAEPADEAAWEITYQNAKTYVNSIGTTWVQSIVEITNTGSTNLYLGSGAYDLEDADGNLVAARTMVSEYPGVLAPGEKGYMYEEATLDEYSGEGELTILPRPDVKEAAVDLIRYDVSEVSVADSSYGDVNVTGRVENTTDETADGMVYVTAFFYDANGVPIGTAFTILTEELPAGSKIGFKLSGFALPDDVTADAIADTVVYAYPMQLQF